YHKVLEKVGSLLSLYRLNSLGQTGGISCWSSSLMSTSFLEKSQGQYLARMLR
uniref:RNase NYN domain-containing protein n=1 Tax=Parascaris univalens TaxID=6257 RepID=A0A914ZXW4_PARUN